MPPVVIMRTRSCGFKAAGNAALFNQKRRTVRCPFQPMGCRVVFPPPDFRSPNDVAVPLARTVVRARAAPIAAEGCKRSR